MQRRLGILTSAVVLLVFGASISAYASPIAFNFDSLAEGASNSSVQTYMRNLLTSQFGNGSSVNVSGAMGVKNYTGDNHVVGPVSGSTVTSLTLGNSNGGVQHSLPWDTYIVNPSTTDRIVMTFNFPIYKMSFDYEIFPNAKCTDAKSTPTESSFSCTEWPDFTFTANGVVVFRTLGLDPEAPGYSGYTHSPSSGLSRVETAPQLLALSGEWSFPGGATTFEFIDWPVRVGIDNLTIDKTPPIPEPGTMLLLGTGIAGLYLKRKKQKAQG